MYNCKMCGKEISEKVFLFQGVCDECLGGKEMTREEAIKSLKNIVEYWTYKPTEVEAAKMAIAALEKQTSTLNELKDEIHKNAVEHGWWEEKISFGDIIALCHSELSEALEEYRDGKPLMYASCSKCGANVTVMELNCCGKPMKPKGIATELADCIIRILDFCGEEGIDIEEAIKIKHEYNKTRPYRHGGKAL